MRLMTESPSSVPGTTTTEGTPSKYPDQGTKQGTPKLIPVSPAERKQLMLTEEVSEAKQRKLNTSDRCDRCGAEAFVYALGMDGELYFCAHHFNKHESAIRSFAIEITDEREFINK